MSGQDVTNRLDAPSGAALEAQKAQQAGSQTSNQTPATPTPGSNIPAIQPQGVITPNVNNIAPSSYPPLGVSGMVQPPIPQFASAGQSMVPSNTGLSFANAMGGKGGNGMGLPQANFPTPHSIVAQSPLPAVFGGKTSGGTNG